MVLTPPPFLCSSLVSPSVTGLPAEVRFTFSFFSFFLVLFVWQRLKVLACSFLRAWKTQYVEFSDKVADSIEWFKKNHPELLSVVAPHLASGSEWFPPFTYPDSFVHIITSFLC